MHCCVLVALLAVSSVGLFIWGCPQAGLKRYKGLSTFLSKKRVHMSSMSLSIVEFLVLLAVPGKGVAHSPFSLNGYAFI